ncbi:MFS transporter [Pseudomonas sp. CFBP13509]|uniref:spinster family MFS transporter n=1 Tax=unclassified Pseudomonas TaxID=196821 RepID=UPI0010BFFCCA|nr:MFS transporter [Pseudomonas sp. CFBP13509]TKJ80320.1 MFS transporter [Pseudomonas sp. CFBP13509]
MSFDSGNHSGSALSEANATLDDSVQKASVGVYPWFVIGVLIFALTLSFIDRQILSLLVGPIKSELQINDTQMSMLQGFAFAIFYVLLAIPVGRAADHYNRRNIIAIGIGVWSFFTALCGFAKNFGIMFLARVGVGAGESSLMPASYSLIADYFPKERVSTAISIFQTGVSLGVGLAMLFGGMVVNYTESFKEVTLPLVGTVSSWRLTFVIVSIPGILAIIALMFVKEPKRKSLEAHHKTHFTIAEVLAYMFQRKRLILSHFLGFSLLATVSSGLMAWSPTYFVRSFGWSAGDAGVYLGLVALFIGTTAIIAGGALVDKLFKAGYRDAPLRIGIFTAIGMAIFGSALAFCNSAGIAQIVMLPLMFCSFSFLGVAPAALQLVLPNNLRAQVSAIYMLTANLVGLGLGPTVIAIVTDYGYRNEAMLKYSLATTIPIVALLAAIVLLSGFKAYRAEHLVQNP